MSILNRKNNQVLRGIVEEGERARTVDPDLLREGLQGTGRVSAIEDTHISFGPTEFSEPVIQVALQVTLPDRPSYPVTIQQRVPRLMVGSVVPGATLAVRVDPADTARVAIDFERQIDPGESVSSDNPS